MWLTCKKLNQKSSRNKVPDIKEGQTKVITQQTSELCSNSSSKPDQRIFLDENHL